MIKRLFKNRQKLIGLVVLLLIAVFSGRHFLSGKETQPQYQTAQVERGTIVASVSASGLVLVSNIQSVTSEASGTVEEIYVKDGDTVIKDQALVKVALDTQGIQNQAQSHASYLSAQNSLESARITAYSLRSEMLSKWKIFTDLATNSTYQNPDDSPNEANRALVEFQVAQDNWLAAEAKYKNQQQAIAQAQASLNSAWLSYQMNRSVVTAPQAGTVTGLNVAEGMQIGSSDTSTGSRLSQRVAAIVTAGNPLISLNVNEIDVPSVKSGQKVTVTVDSLPDKTFTGEIVSADKIGTITSGVASYPVVVRLDNKAPQILPNMSVSGNIITASKSDVLIVPSGTVQNQNGQTVVRVLKNGQVQAVPVETGLASATQTEIVSGVSAGDQVIVGTNNLGTSTTSGGGSPFGGGGFGAIRGFRRD